MLILINIYENRLIDNEINIILMLIIQIN